VTSIVLENDSTVVECSPGHGFTITSIFNKFIQKNILWEVPGKSTPNLDGDLGPSGNDSIKYFNDEILVGGWFPMFPTAGLPGEESNQWMHGTAPRLPWEVIYHDESTITAELTLNGSEIKLTRTLKLVDSKVSVEMFAFNQSSEPVKITFGEHPCFDRKIFAGGRVRLSDQVNPWVEDVNFEGSENQEITWNWSEIPDFPDGRHEHILFKAPSGHVEVTSAKFDISIQMNFDTSFLPYLLLWEHFDPVDSNLSGDVFGLEPISYGGTHVGKAIGRREETVLPPKGTLKFTTNIMVNRR